MVCRVSVLEEFSKEVVTTSLHELGHHLGMQESHLENWGL